MTTTPASGAADLIAAAQAVVDRWDTPLWKDAPATAEYIGRLRAALASAPAQPVAEPAPSATAHVGDSLFESWFSEYNPALRGTKQLMRDAYAAGMDDGKVAPLPSAAYAALPEYGINTASHAHFRVLGFTADQMRAFADATHTLRASHGQAPATVQADSVQEDVVRMNWLDTEGGMCVFHIGKTWYTRSSYGLPHRKRTNLRAAIDAAMADAARAAQKDGS